MSGLDKDKDELLGNNRPEDVSWLYSLSDSELDMLISLKKLAIQRAKFIGNEVLANKFDLKMLRAIGYILMEDLKGRFKNSSVISGLAESSTILDCCNLSRNLKDTFASMNSEDLSATIDTKSRKRTIVRPYDEGMLNRKKQKTEKQS